MNLGKYQNNIEEFRKIVSDHHRELGTLNHEVNEALEKLAQNDKRKADLVKLRYFAGLTAGQAAEVLGISRSTADELWAYARAWLRLEIRKGDET